jgi:hypothetical protein
MHPDRDSSLGINQLVRSFNEVRRVRTGNGLSSLHEELLVERDVIKQAHEWEERRIEEALDFWAGGSAHSEKPLATLMYAQHHGCPLQGNRSSGQ